VEYHEISLLLRSHTPILVVETHEELRALELLKDIAANMGHPAVIGADGGKDRHAATVGGRAYGCGRLSAGWCIGDSPHRSATGC